MPMIDVYAATGTFPGTAQLAKDLAAAVMAVEGVPNIPMFRKNTAAFLWGHAHTNAELVAAARAEIAKLQAQDN